MMKLGFVTSVARGILGGKGLDPVDLESAQNVVTHTDGD